MAYSMLLFGCPSKFNKFKIFPFKDFLSITQTPENNRKKLINFNSMQLKKMYARKKT